MLKETKKSLVMDSLFRLKNIETKFNKITISHDMTKKEREECKLLVDEAIEKERTDMTCRGNGCTE